MSCLTINQLIYKYEAKIEYVGIKHSMVQKFKSIQDNKSKDSERLFAADGIWAHQKLIKTDLRIICFLLCPELIYSNDGLDLAEEFILKAEKTFIVSRKTFEKLSDREEPGGFASIVLIPEFKIEQLQTKNDALILVLDGLEKPGNIGTILRTCDGAGVDAVFVCNKRARITNPKLVKGSMGAAFTIPIIDFEDATSCIKWLRDNDFKIYLADTRSDKNYKSCAYNGNTALIMGSERYGISAQWYNYNSQLISIPMMGTCDSLNVGVAASIIIYEISLSKSDRKFGCKSDNFCKR